jgi:hypothetical protein
MDLTSAQRKLAFAVIVLVLAGLGAFLLLSGVSPARHGAAPRPGTSRPASTAPAVPAATPAPVSPPPAAVVRQFCAYYATYSYTESAGGYVGRMRGLVTPTLAATLAQDYATPGVAQARTQQKQSATGSGVITALRAFGPASLTFVVTVKQKTYRTQRAGKTTASVASGAYAVTTTQSGSGWQVNDIELASAGNS